MKELLKYQRIGKGTTADKKAKSIFSNDKKQVDKFFLLCIAICIATAFFSFFFFIMKGNGAFTLRDDFNSQQLPFNNHINGFLKQSLPGEWDWNIDMGASFVNSFSFYGLGSPFSWLSLIFPREVYPYLAGWLYIIKYVIAGVTSYFYLRTMNGRGSYSEVICAVAYAFSGYSACALEFHFHDAIALFPLLLIGMERLMKGKGSWFFSFSVFINCLVNYYFFIGEVLFLILYYIFRFGRRREWFLKGIVKCLAAGTLGVGMACILFLPNILYILGNPRSGSHLTPGEDLVPDLRQVLYILKGMLLPGDAMHDQVAVEQASWTSTACWLPLFGCSMPISYMIKKRKDWLTGILILMTVFSFSPFLSSSFVMFTQNYQRWWYMYVMMAALATTAVLNDIESFPVKTSIFLNLLLTVGLYAVLCHLDVGQDEENRIIFHPARLKIYVLIAVGGLLLSILIIFLAKGRIRYGLLLAGISASACATTFYAVHIYRIDAEDTHSILTNYNIASHLDVIDPQYRYRFEYWSNVFPLAGDVGGLGAFSSTCANSRFEFNDLFDYHHNVRSINKEAYEGLAELLGGRYALKSKNNLDEEDIVVREFTEDDRAWCIVEKPACPIGYKVENYILKDDLMEIRKKKRGIALLYSPVIDEKDEVLVSAYADRVTSEDIDFKADILPQVEQAGKQCVQNFQRSSRGLTCMSDFDSESLIFFSVYYDPGWMITIDGNSAEPIDSGGLILLNVPAGKHTIDFTYRTPGLRTGILISLASFIALFLSVFLTTNKRGPFTADEYGQSAECN